jgi:hypothetical protein
MKSKMKKNSFIVILGLTVVMQSCGLPYCKKFQLENEDLLWLTPYEKGDMIIFRSELDRLDTILITDKDITNPSNTCIFDLRGCNWMEGDNEFKASAGFEFIFIHDTVVQKNGIDLGGIFRIKKHEKNRPALPELSLCELYSRKNTIYKDTSIFLLKKQIVDCLVLHRDECDIGESQPQLGIKSFVWSKRHGLVQYTIETGEKFKYFKKISVERRR